MAGKTIAQAFGELDVTSAPTGFVSVNRVYFQSEPDGLKIMWYFNVFSWEGRCISPRILTSAPTMPSIINNEIAIVLGTTTEYYLSAGAGSTTWNLYTANAGGGGGGS